MTVLWRCVAAAAGQAWKFENELDILIDAAVPVAVPCWRWAGGQSRRTSVMLSPVTGVVLEEILVVCEYQHSCFAEGTQIDYLRGRRWLGSCRHCCMAMLAGDATGCLSGCRGVSPFAGHSPACYYYLKISPLCAEILERLKDYFGPHSEWSFAAVRSAVPGSRLGRL